jgi:uncharacterized protein YukE
MSDNIHINIARVREYGNSLNLSKAQIEEISGEINNITQQLGAVWQDEEYVNFAHDTLILLTKLDNLVEKFEWIKSWIERTCVDAENVRYSS